MQKWEYLSVRLVSHQLGGNVENVVYVNDRKEVVTELKEFSDWVVLNKLGNEGWELVSVATTFNSNLTYFLRRQISN